MVIGYLGSFYSPIVTVFFYNGKSFALRGVKEQIELCFEQLVRMENPDRYKYYEYGSKNHSGGVSDKSQGKIVTILDTFISYFSRSYPRHLFH